MADDNVWTEKLDKMALDKEKVLLRPHQRPGEPCGYKTHQQSTSIHNSNDIAILHIAHLDLMTHPAEAS